MIQNNLGNDFLILSLFVTLMSFAVFHTGILQYSIQQYDFSTSKQLGLDRYLKYDIFLQ